MTDGTSDHNRIAHNIHAALRTRLRGTRCSCFGPDLGVRTIGKSVRFPDALVTCTKFPGTERLAPDVVVVFEVVSPNSGRHDRIEKVREYAAVASIRRYVIVEAAGKGLFVMHRNQGNAAFTILTLTWGDLLEMPVAEFDEDVVFEATYAGV
jgi:Uma2 family endonuclease